MSRRWLLALGLVAVLVAIPMGWSSAGAAPNDLAKIDHFVFIYEENHSFDNLYGGWEGVNGRSNADAAHTSQVGQNGATYVCLKQDDVNLTSPPLAAPCSDSTTGSTFTSAFANAPFPIDNYIPATANTCPAPGDFSHPNGFVVGAALPGGCTRDLVHRYYQEQYQLDGGKQDRYMTGSDAVGLTMGYYNTAALPVYKYLHSKDHPDYAIEDNLFQSAFGGSFLNHQFLITAAAPTFAGALDDGSSGDLHSILDVNGFPNSTYPLYHPATAVKDSQLTQSCGKPTTIAGFACGDYAVNTTQPWYQPYSPGTADAKRMQPLGTPTIGDRLSSAGVDWAWYAGGWSNANGDIGGPGWTNGLGPTCYDPATLSTAVFPNCPDKTFQFHHQPFNYYSKYAPGTAARANHLRDEQEFMQLAQSSTDKACNLKPVSFVKPIGSENEHPGYASESSGSSHLVELLQAIEQSKACAKNTMVFVTYDEFGGQWDHVPPPGQGTTTAGPHDMWGPGTRIPGIVLAPDLKNAFVLDSAEHDTTSILSTLEHRYSLAPLGTRDAAVNDLATVFDAVKPKR
jgi:phospholipase C